VEELLAPVGPVAAVNEQDRIVVYTEQNSAAFAEAVQHLSRRLRIHPSGFEVRTMQSIPRLANDKIDYCSLGMRPESTRPQAEPRPGANPGSSLGPR
jgi:hypothetical protein